MIADGHFSFKLFLFLFFSFFHFFMSPILFNVYIGANLISMKQFLLSSWSQSFFSTVFFCCPVLRTLIWFHPFTRIFVLVFYSMYKLLVNVMNITRVNQSKFMSSPIFLHQTIHFSFVDYCLQRPSQIPAAFNAAYFSADFYFCFASLIVFSCYFHFAAFQLISRLNWLLLALASSTGTYLENLHKRYNCLLFFSAFLFTFYMRSKPKAVTAIPKTKILFFHNSIYLLLSNKCINHCVLFIIKHAML
jgi:hypothetical protein